MQSLIIHDIFGSFVGFLYSRHAPWGYSTFSISIL
ncbi:hypothetical protein M3J09_004868 [Ascochyta lentis]